MGTNALLVASTGGHLEELHQLRSQVVTAHRPSTWVSFDTEQTRSMLAGESLALLEPIPTRGYGALLRNIPKALRILFRERPSEVVSTGSGIALLFLPFAFLVGASAWYVESATRTVRPSLTGRLLSLLPWVRVTSQYDTLSAGRWSRGPSVFDRFTDQVQGPAERADRVRILVMLGTQGFAFERLVAAVLRALPEHADVVWQVGSTPVPHELPGSVHRLLSREELGKIAADCTAVVSHAGVGSALTAMAGGVRPILVPRLSAHAEHVDDHQVDLAGELARRGVAVTAGPEELDRDLLSRDYRFRVTV